MPQLCARGPTASPRLCERHGELGSTRTTQKPAMRILLCIFGLGRTASGGHGALDKPTHSLPFFPLQSFESKPVVSSSCKPRISLSPFPTSLPLSLIHI